MSDALLAVRNLKTYFYARSRVVRAVDDVSFSLTKGETLGIVGESGCGKSVTALSVIGLIPSPPGKIIGGQVIFEGEDLLRKTRSEMRSTRGNRISMVFQEPMTSLNPVLTVGQQIMEAMTFHLEMGRNEARARAIHMLRAVGIPSPERRIDDYPHQMSGGMRQRVMIAMALSCGPKLLIADEPTTALDVTIQAQVLNLIMKLQDELGISIMLITHDLGVVAQIADRVSVMYAGKIVESAGVADLFSEPVHPYTIGLLDSIPRMGHRCERLKAIPGQVPNSAHTPKGCRFHPRCGYAREICAELEPQPMKVRRNHQASCWRLVDYKI